MSLILGACASGPQHYAQLPDVSADECAVISAYLRDLPKSPSGNGGVVTFLSIARGGIELGANEKLSPDTVIDLRAKFGHSARLDACTDLKEQVAAAGWRFAPRIPRHLGDKGWYGSVDRVGLNGDHTEAVLREAASGTYGAGRFIWFGTRTLLFRKDPRTGQWRQVAELESVTT